MMPAFHRGKRGETGRLEQVVDTTAPKIPHTLKGPALAPERGIEIKKQIEYNG